VATAPVATAAMAPARGPGGATGVTAAGAPAARSR
jgi:hypothetical protein